MFSRLFEETAHLNGEAVALCCESASVTYSELNAQRIGLPGISRIWVRARGKWSRFVCPGPSTWS